MQKCQVHWFTGSLVPVFGFICLEGKLLLSQNKTFQGDGQFFSWVFKAHIIYQENICPILAALQTLYDDIEFPLEMKF